MVVLSVASIHLFVRPLVYLSVAKTHIAMRTDISRCSGYGSLASSGLGSIVEQAHLVSWPSVV